MRLIGEEVPRSQIATEGVEQPLVTRMVEIIRERVFKDYVDRNGLAATPAEIAEIEAYDLEFEKKDRAQRARKLAELDSRLDSGGLDAQERPHVEEFRNALRRLAQRDADLDRQPAADPQQLGAFFKPWIEMWKMNGALYERYGGAVALTESGPYPHGAWAQLIADYEREGRLQFYDSALRDEVFALLAAPPSLTIPPERVDFTPYWKKPIPPSYFPD